MNKQVIAIGLLAALFISATQGFAQQVITQVPKKLNPAKLERMVTQGTARLAPRIPGVYIPAGTTIAALERRISVVAQKANISLDEKDVRVIAYNPERLRQFQAQAGMAIFEGRPVPYKQGIKILQANQKKFADARANGEYEEAWKEFIEQSQFVPFREGKSYGNPNDIANDVYNFYVKHMGIENLPRVRTNYLTDVEGVVLEIPVNGLEIIRYIDYTYPIYIMPEEFVVVHYNNGSSHLVHRTQFEGDAGMAVYRVIK